MSEEGLSFAGWKSLAKWLIQGKSGKRFCKWFARKYWRELLATEWGAEFHDWIQKNNHAENTDRTKMVLVEFRERDLVVVYGVGISCAFVSRVATQDAAGDLLAEKLLEMDLPYRAKSLLDPRHIIGMQDFRVETVVERWEREHYEQVWGAIGKAGASTEGAGCQQS
jgi:hypothetical protein